MNAQREKVDMWESRICHRILSEKAESADQARSLKWKLSNSDGFQSMELSEGGEMLSFHEKKQTNLMKTTKVIS